MVELVGNCRFCGREIFCRDGFLNGIVEGDKTLCCYDCKDNEAAGRGSNS